MHVPETPLHRETVDRLHRPGGIGPLVARIVGAIFGGYALAMLSSVAALVLPMPAPQAVLTGMLASFIVYAGAVIWVFIARSSLRAWAGLLMAAVPLALAAWSAMSMAAAAGGRLA